MDTQVLSKQCCFSNPSHALVHTCYPAILRPGRLDQLIYIPLPDDAVSLLVHGLCWVLLIEALPTQVFQVVAKSSRQRAGKGLILFSNQYTNYTLEAQKAQCPGPVTTLVYKYPVSPMTLNHVYNSDTDSDSWFGVNCAFILPCFVLITTIKPFNLRK